MSSPDGGTVVDSGVPRETCGACQAPRFGVATCTAGTCGFECSGGYVKKPGACAEPTRIVVTGGAALDNGAGGALWEWDGNTWAQRSSGLASFACSSMFSLDGRLLVLSEISGVGRAGTWQWSGREWTYASASVDPERCQPMVAAFLGKAVAFGGSNPEGIVSNRPFGDTFVWNGSTWKDAEVAGPPPRRHGALTAVKSELVLFGGSEGASSSHPIYLGDTWRWDGTRWSPAAVDGPPARQGHSMAALGDKVYVFGGVLSDGKEAADTWEWDGHTWHQLSVSGPAARAYATLTRANGALVLFGGKSGSNESVRLYDDTWEWNGSAWRERVATSKPEARCGHMAAAY